jgi:drug/metabolite transporter (DMT)-like permease
MLYNASVHWLLLTFLAIVSRAIFGPANKILTNYVRLSPIMLSALFSLATMVLAIVASPFLGGLSFNGLGTAWPTMLVIIVVLAFGGILFFMGQTQLDVGTTQIALSSILIWSVVFSIIFLGSSFSLMQGVGIALLVAAIAGAQYRKGKRKLSPAVLYILATAVFFAAFQVLSAVVAKHLTVGTYIVLAYGGSLILTIVLYGRQLHTELPQLAKHRPARVIGPLLLTNGTYVFYLVFAYYAYRAAPDPGVVVVLITTQVVLGVILGALFLKEREYLLRKIAAGVLATVAGILIQSSH